MPARRRTPRVALLIETSRTYAREILAGVRRFVAEQGPWSSYLELRAADSSAPGWLRNWDGDGLLVRTFSKETAGLVAATGLPAVELRSPVLSPGLPFVGNDNARLGRMVAEHFLERGYRNFAVHSLHTEPFFTERVRNYVAALAELGHACAELPAASSERAEDWERAQRTLVRWLSGLPKPVAVFAANDQLGVRLLEACRRGGLASPEEVAVVGAENEETLCGFATPTLSSVRFDGHAVGYAAAGLLDRLMRGRRVPPGPTLIPPKGIVVRGSSGGVAQSDRLVSQALRVIREESLAGLDVNALCRRLNASRSTLDRRMKAALRRSPKEEIHRVRFEEVERLLRETRLTVAAVAEQTGFRHSHYLQAVFKVRYGMTPGRFRKLRASPSGAL
ncbi:MAG: XylR family transcriptional regulator [Opitutales bacterium]|jgi:LacI family transcriptional regulator